MTAIDSTTSAEPAAPVPLREGPALRYCRTGKWSWPRTIFGTLFVIVGWIFTFVVLVTPVNCVSALWYERPINDFTLVADRPDSFAVFLTFAMSIVIPTMLVLRFLHRLSWRAALGSERHFDWDLFVRAAIAYLLVAVLGLAVTYVGAPQRMRIVPHGWQHGLWIALAMLVILPQAFAEDYLFKGYLVRAWGAVIPCRFVVIPLLAAGFTSLHAVNPDVNADRWFNLIQFFLAQLLMFGIFVRTGNLASAVGMHWAQNVIAFCLLKTPNNGRDDFALIDWLDPRLAAGVSRLSDPLAYVELAVGLFALWALLSWKRSPLYLRSASPL